MLKNDKMSLNMYELVLIWFSATTTLWEVWLRFTFWDVFFFFFLQYDELKKHPVIRSPVDQNDSLFREVIDLCHQKAY